MRLDLAARAHADVLLDLDKRADKHVVPQLAAIQVAGLDHHHVLPGLHVINPALAGADLGCHGLPPSSNATY
ncbi:hypothetical protein D3C71_2131880 [compost metagenome]